MASSTVSTSSTPAPDANMVIFARGIIARLDLWPALRLAVQESWGGPESVQKCTWMASTLVDAFDPAESQETPDADYIEGMLLQMMSDEYEAVLEDGSAESTAKDVVRLWTQLQDSKGESLVRQWEEQAQKLKGKKVEHREEVGEDSDWSDESGSGESDDAMEEDVPALIPRQEHPQDKPEVDEDGFTLVKGKGKSHR